MLAFGGLTNPAPMTERLVKERVANLRRACTRGQRARCLELCRALIRMQTRREAVGAAAAGAANVVAGLLVAWADDEAVVAAAMACLNAVWMGGCLVPTDRRVRTALILDRVVDAMLLHEGSVLVASCGLRLQGMRQQGDR